jgi:hypothetical protein
MQRAVWVARAPLQLLLLLLFSSAKASAPSSNVIDARSLHPVPSGAVEGGLEHAFDGFFLYKFQPVVLVNVCSRGGSVWCGLGLLAVVCCVCERSE